MTKANGNVSKSLIAQPCQHKNLPQPHLNILNLSDGVACRLLQRCSGTGQSASQGLTAWYRNSINEAFLVTSDKTIATVFSFHVLTETKALLNDKLSIPCGKSIAPFNKLVGQIIILPDYWRN